MFEYVDFLDLLGLYKEADTLQKTLLANNFMLTKQKINPRKKMENKLDSINGQLSTMMGTLDDNNQPSGDDSNITVEPFKENNVEKVKFDIKK